MIAYVLLTISIAITSQQEGEPERPEVFDPLARALPENVSECFANVFPGYRIWEINKSLEADAHYEMIVFDPRSQIRRSWTRNGITTNSIPRYRVVISRDGKIVQADKHPIRSLFVPEVLKFALSKISNREPNFPHRKALDWWSMAIHEGQIEYHVRISSSPVQSYSAKFEDNGTLISQEAHGFELSAPNGR